uniref:Uncharacterized protein n=1 Tax=Lactuca sativa TaxID=4236 RepID=A0A9R1VL83_LACSA|nr:hypothetical protein LSAT_V11C500277350 [Lactuca sativa]
MGLDGCELQGPKNLSRDRRRIIGIAQNKSKMIEYGQLGELGGSTSSCRVLNGHSVLGAFLEEVGRLVMHSEGRSFRSGILSVLVAIWRYNELDDLSYQLGKLARELNESVDELDELGTSDDRGKAEA